MGYLTMVFENDPFEDFKRKRQVKELESSFLDQAETRHAHLEDLVRSSNDKSELTDRIESEMEDFFADSQEQVSRIIRDYDHPDQGLIDEQVQEEMSDFFRESKQAAAEILEALGENDGGLDDAANRMVDHLKNVFEQSMEHIADVQEKYGVGTEDEAGTDAQPAVTPLSDLVQSMNEFPEGKDPFRPDSAAIPGQAETAPPVAADPPDAAAQDPLSVDLSVLDDILADPVPHLGAQPPAPASKEPLTPPPAMNLPQPPVARPASVSAAEVASTVPTPVENPAAELEMPEKVNRGSQPAVPARVSENGAEDQASAPQRILRRQAHLPSGKGRKTTLSAEEIHELRALKEILLNKGIVTREEIEEQLGRPQDAVEPLA